MKALQITKDDHIQGSSSAPVVLVEYGDYECSYCGRAYPIVKRLQKKFGDKLTFVFRNYPLVQIHRRALHAAMAAEAAGKQGKYWEMHDILYENQQHLHDDTLVEYADEIGLNTDRFQKEFGSDEATEKIQRDIESGNVAGVQGTPAFYINGRFFDGNWMTSDLEDAIEAEL